MGSRFLSLRFVGENDSSLSLFKKLGYTECAHYKQVAEKFGRKLDVIDFQKIL